MIGSSVGHYRILDRLGGGGMGVVYEAEDEKLGRRVALKLLSPELADGDNGKKRLLSEARAASKLDHPNICTIYEVGEEEDGRHAVDIDVNRGPDIGRPRVLTDDLGPRLLAEVSARFDIGGDGTIVGLKPDEEPLATIHFVTDWRTLLTDR